MNLLAKDLCTIFFLSFSEGGIAQAGFSFRFRYNMSYEQIAVVHAVVGLGFQTVKM